jgi:hypothetical protein
MDAVGHSTTPGLAVLLAALRQASAITKLYGSMLNAPARRASLLWPNPGECGRSWSAGSSNSVAGRRCQTRRDAPQGKLCGVPWF